MTEPTQMALAVALLAMAVSLMIQGADLRAARRERAAHGNEIVRLLKRVAALEDGAPLKRCDDCQAEPAAPVPLMTPGEPLRYLCDGCFERRRLNS